MKKKVLIVEDDFIIQMFLEQLIEQEGCEIVGVASSGDEALALIKECKPDLIFLDVGISGSKSGIDVAKIINDTSKIPFVFVTGNSDKRTLAALKATNPISIMFKPIDDVSFTKQFNEIYGPNS